MADGAGNTPGRPGPGRPPTYVPSYDAPTTPMPRMTPEQAWAVVQAAKAAEGEATSGRQGRSTTGAASPTAEAGPGEPPEAGDGEPRPPAEEGAAETPPTAEGEPGEPRFADDDAGDGEAPPSAEARHVRTRDAGPTAGLVEAAGTDGANDGAGAEVTVNVRRPAGPFLHPYGGATSSPGTRERPDTRPAAASDDPDADPDVEPDRPPAGSGAVSVWRAASVSAASAGASSAANRSADGAPVTEEDLLRQAAADAGTAPESRIRRQMKAAILRVGDIPIKAIYGVGATIVTAIVVVLVFVVFSGDKPGPAHEDPVRVGRPAASQAPRAATPRPTPTSAPVALPPVPAAKAMKVFSGPGTPVASYVTDRTAGISYPKYGAPWVASARAGFSAGQHVGSQGRPQALIGSGPVPVAVSKAPATYEDVRALAAKVARWSLRHQPAGAKLTWTVSQRSRYGLGWLLGYKVSYAADGEKHTSEAYVMVISTAKKRPAMLFASVPDTRKALYRDLNMLFWTARAI